MSTQQEMAKLLEQWLRLTEAEAGAIQSAAWLVLREVQAAKTSLQSRLAQAREKWELENPGHGSKTGPVLHPFHAELGRLLSLETRNGELLAAQVRRAQAEKESLKETVRNLRNVQRTYASKPQGAWNCYS
ncbi:MAG TPA: hypothetical protein VFC07_02425 [Verrucomicrobiae bacterium]|nr:hypothetical protein [Verrucomicrobiae bacterium]